ncbi:MAG: response regulator [Hormoscilla sp.]
MSYAIDPAVLEAIAQEAKQSFLEEDAPGYLETLQEGLQQIDGSPDYKVLMRAAHSVKGGAAIAQMPGLSKLAHKLEDLLEGFNHQQVKDLELGKNLLQQGLEELAFMLSEALRSESDVEADSQLLEMLDIFNSSLQEETSLEESKQEKTRSPGKVGLIKTALESDLEECLTTAEKILQESTAPSDILDGMMTLVDECMLLGEAFDLPWLVEAIAPLAEAVDKSPPDSGLGKLASETIAKVRSQRAQFIEEISSPTPPAKETADHRTDTVDQKPASESGEANVAKTPNSPAGGQGGGAAAPSQLRIPLERIDEMGSIVGELITSHERLTIQQQQIKQASQNLRRIVDQVKPVHDQVRVLYDQMLTVTAANTITDPAQSMGEFDSLEMDRYTALHSSLQTFEELITQIQETRVDIDLVSGELAQELNQVRVELTRLYSDVTESRLVPFQTFAQRFLPQLNRLTQRLGKSAQLEIEGENVLVDKVLIEQLQTPLTHLLNNALDHAIELPGERVALDKPATAKIQLGAKTQGNEVVVTFTDDGRGIDLKKIYQKAIDKGLCDPDRSMNQLRREEILNFIFQSGFSTSAQVSDVSGRGVGLDIVKTQVQQLRGSLECDTRPGQGTTFTIRLPLSLSFLSLLLCQVGQQMVAIPTDSILEVIPYNDMLPVLQQHISSVTWREQLLPLRSLTSLLPYNNAIGSSASVTPKVALIVNGSDSPMAVTVDAIVDERQLIIKSFDDTVPVPPYIAGCTILGTGEAVPVVLPRFLKPQGGKQGSQQSSKEATQTRPNRITNRTILVAEDSTGARRSIERILTQAGFAVIACRDGQEALEELLRRQGGIDLVLSDVEMPQLNGFDLLQKIRTHSFWYSLPVVMLTSRTGDRHRQKAMSLGANDYLGKPITPVELLTGIDALIPASA